MIVPSICVYIDKPKRKGYKNRFLFRDTETGVPPERANPTNIRVGVDQMGPEPTIQQVLNDGVTLEVLGSGSTRWGRSQLFNRF